MLLRVGLSLCSSIIKSAPVATRTFSSRCPFAAAAPSPLLSRFEQNVSLQICREFGKRSGSNLKKDSRDSLYYIISIGVVAVGVTFAAIPAYRIFCESTSFGGLTQVAKDFEKIENMKKVEDRLIRVQFNADIPSSMQWKFKPLQHELHVHPGETALAFYTATNPTDKPIIGISSYNLTPFQAAYYFNKIQCFCFEEQILNPGETVDLPVFFYIDPDYANDPNLEYLDNILLSYTFFEAKSGLKLPDPFDPNNRPTAKLEKNSGPVAIQAPA
ncbi:hypothetical protein L596_029197 [Steinernema carpocapsae]|uniref:Cytochrome c oxidase assembly protein COX11, mitochondrial n=1 Tax=Steinernema carpocapsae TaxID=34508 RepID=A0A4U5LTX4_STECR|nr:hypothetical protein L596_029197 [Steinernema carpocapsae]